MRVPPEGTVPRGYEPYPYEQAESIWQAQI